MRWAWRIEQFDPGTTTPEQLVAAKRLHDCGRGIGAVVGIIAAVVIYSIWMRFGYENKWVEYTIFPATVIGGCTLYRIVYEIVIRFRR